MDSKLWLIVFSFIQIVIVYVIISVKTFMRSESASSIVSGIECVTIIIGISGVLGICKKRWLSYYFAIVCDIFSIFYLSYMVSKAIFMYYFILLPYIADNVRDKSCETVYGQGCLCNFRTIVISEILTCDDLPRGAVVMIVNAVMESIAILLCVTKAVISIVILT